MFQSLNSNNDISKMVRIHCENLRLTPRESAQLGLKTELSMKSDYGTKLESILIDISLQVGKNVLDSHGAVMAVLEFFDSFTSSDSWVEQIELNINDALNKQKQLNKVG